MTLKQEHYIFGMIGFAAVVVLYLLYKESQAGQSTAPINTDAISGASVVPAANAAQVYPAVAPIQLGDVILQVAPPEQTYNAQMDGALLPDVQIDPGTGYPQDACCNDCDPAGTPVTVQHISQALLDSASSNLASFSTKVAPAPAKARVTFTAA